MHFPKRQVKFTTTQKRVIIALNVIILAIVIPFLIITFWPGGAPYLGGGNIDIPADAQPYERLRDARMSLNPHIDWETNIGGTGNDIPSVVVNHGGHFHIFGTTTSTDLDFETEISGQKLSMATLSMLGRTQNFAILDSGPSINVVKGIRFGNGITLLLYNRSDTAIIARITCDGTITHSFERANSQGVEFIMDSGRIVLVVRHEQGSFHSGLTVLILNENLQLDNSATWHTRSTNISHRSLEFNSIFPAGGDRFRVFATDTFRRAPVIIEFSQSFNPHAEDYVHNVGLPSVPNFELHDVVPFVDGASRFMMTGVSNGEPHLIAVKFENNRFAGGGHFGLAGTMGITGATHTRFLMVDCNDGPPEFFVFASSPERSAVRRLARGSTPLAPPSTAFDSLNNSAFVAYTILSRPNAPSHETLLFGSDLNNNLFLSRLSPNTAVPLLTFGGQRTDTAVAMTLTDRGVIIIASTNSDERDVGANFGGIDTWVAFVPM